MELSAADAQQIPVFLVQDSQKTFIDPYEAGEYVSKCRLIVHDPNHESSEKWLHIRDFPAAEEVGMLLVPAYGIIFIRLGVPSDFQ